MIEFKHITKTFFSNKALDDVSFKAYSGEILALLGTERRREKHPDENSVRSL